MIRLPSFAKINLCLELLGERPDGYAEIRTIFQSLRLADEMTFERAPAGVLEVSCDDPDVPSGEENLVWQSARLLMEGHSPSPPAGARIAIRKKIPAGAGLGGGSSNAAVALVVLARLWKMNLPAGRLLDLAARVGSDVPFFLHGGTALGLGRGDEVYPLPDIDETDVLIAVPPFRIRTAETYSRARMRLTARSGGHTIRRFALRSLPGETGYSYVINELEPAASQERDMLPALRRRLVELGAEAAALCGSGSAVFGLFPDGSPGCGRLEEARGLLSREFPGLRTLRSRTLRAADYYEALYESAGV
ncbi:MAG: 4-(cytidine 5'-diphospho)-2-C-methyl-D-erythritol kinase [Acidobacteria bacterium]|nr:MAG: 4-(cytidine 5'-diphospho)-2-C-methyl-D-erythritol kinase [Acidobacteriota bacterium]